MVQLAKRVGVIGSGAVGTYFGVRLAQLGHDVRFLVRQPQLEVPPAFVALSETGGDFELLKPRTAPAPAALRDEGEDLDWVLVCLKSTALGAGAGQGAALGEMLAPCVGPRTRIQFLMNGIGVEELGAAHFGGKRVHGGLVYGGLTRLDTGVARHAGVPAEIHGGSFIDDPAELAAAAALWQPVGGGAAPGAVAFKAQPCLRFARWGKLCWNIPFNGLTIAAGGVSVHEVWEHAATRAVARTLIEEIVATANADLDAHAAPPECRFDVALLWDKLSGITQSMSDVHYYPSTTLDFNAGNPLELTSIFEEPLRRAEALKIHTPTLQTLVALLQLLDRKHLKT
ncbi:ketopantoate reductase PanE/ApbA-domain-containing protein [Pelagophyceae sp. CCMP2097]|nr:ketopantoate reductase PanE/ApbA-domain-containing protein [Pelagophyceae sp. CCMP2097]